jgi:ribose 5-phosphate isomerase A
MALTADEIKKITGKFSADLVRPGMRIGLGTGSTVHWLIRELGERVRQGLDIVAVPTSRQTEEMAMELNIPLTDLSSLDHLDLDIDGADQIDPSGNLIKGGGGALLQEKIVAFAARQLVVIADETKLASVLGSVPLPIEVIPFGERQVQAAILAQGDCSRVQLRTKNGVAFTTDHGHHILDCFYNSIEDATALNQFLNTIPGVVDTGLFLGMTYETIIGYADGNIKRTLYK